MTSVKSDFTTCELPEDVLNDGVEDLKDIIRREISLVDKEYHDMTFLNKFLSDDMLCGRFVWYNAGDAQKSFDQVMRTAKWRRTRSVPDVKRGDLQMYLIKEKVFYPSRYDVNGDRLVYLILKNHKATKEREIDNKKSYIFLKEKLLKMTPTHKMTLVVDCSDAGLANADVSLFTTIIGLLLSYYPNTLGYALVYDMKWYFNVFWKMVKVALPKHYRDKVITVNKKTIQEYVSKDNLPPSMGGNEIDECDTELLDFVCDNLWCKPT